MKSDDRERRMHARDTISVAHWAYKCERTEQRSGTMHEPHDGQTEQAACMNSSDRDDRTADRLSSLSPRESEVFRLMGLGHGTREIADMLHVTRKTVQTFVDRIKKKLRIRGRSQLVREAVLRVAGAAIDHS
jgi:DNA-binding CsgD family transcriptional regulator